MLAAEMLTEIIKQLPVAKLLNRFLKKEHAALLFFFIVASFAGSNKYSQISGSRGAVISCDRYEANADY